MPDWRDLAHLSLTSAVMVALGPLFAWAQGCTPATAMPDTVVTDVNAPGIMQVWFDGPTTRYTHAILGDGVEPTALWVTTSAGRCQGVALDPSHVFEDLAPRPHDLDGDGRVEVIVVRTHVDLGAQLAVYALTPDDSALNLIATTPYIGQTRRWLAPVGVADLDGDGVMEIAYVDQPHLARILRVVRYVPTPGGADLVPVAAASGLTNHRIGEAFISGGIRECGDGPQIVTADADWERVLVTTLAADGALTARVAAPFSQAALAEVMACAR